MGQGLKTQILFVSQFEVEQCASEFVGALLHSADVFVPYYSRTTHTGTVRRLSLISAHTCHIGESEIFDDVLVFEAHLAFCVPFMKHRCRDLTVILL